MKNYNNTAVPATPIAPARTASELAADIAFHEAETVDALGAILRHPRSLARPTPHWRPPSKQLPAIGAAAGLTASITRHRVGGRVKARVRGFGETRVPAYLIALRLTDPTGARVDGNVAEAWVRSLLPAAQVDAVHEVGTGYATTFLWLVDSDYLPVHSPASLFGGFSQAA